MNNQIYIGSTNNLQRRLWHHNNGFCLATKCYRPWKIISAILVCGEGRARKLEKYFKTGSGKAILKKRILQLEQIFSYEIPRLGRSRGVAQ